VLRRLDKMFVDQEGSEHLTEFRRLMRERLIFVDVGAENGSPRLGAT